MQRLRTYTVEEANNELPRVRRIVEQIAQLSALVPELEDQARIAQYESKRPGAGPEHNELSSKRATLSAVRRWSC